LLWSSPPERILALNCRDRLDCVCATNRLHSWLGKAEVLHLAFLNQFLHRSRHVFDWHVGVDPVLIEQIDHIGSESLERSVSNFFDVLRSAIQLTRPRIAGGRRSEPKLRSDHHLLTHRSERFAHKFLVREWAVNFSGIEEGDAKFNRFAKQRDHLLLIFRRTVADRKSTRL